MENLNSKAFHIEGNYLKGEAHLRGEGEINEEDKESLKYIEYIRRELTRLEGLIQDGSIGGQKMTDQLKNVQDMIDSFTFRVTGRV